MRVVAALALATMLLMCATAVDALAPKGDVLTLDYTFEKYVKDYRKPYVRGTGEYARREAQFKASLARVLQWNSHPDKKYTKGINHMSDWTAPEYKAIRGTRHTPEHQSPFAKKWKGQGGEAPPSVDWRKSNPPVLTAVKDQGNCGDCWAHAVTEAVESAYARATGDLYVLSQQQVTSCTPGVGECFGCGGFFPQYAYDFIAQAGQNASMGLVEEWFYSFTSWEGDSGTCFTNMTKPLDNGIVAAVAITGFNQVQNNSQEAVMEAVATLGPLSILVDATSWQEYESGVFTGCSPYGQGDFELDHAVMLVGYGHDTVSGYDYWIVRNSWSAAWGENGYIRIQKDTAAPQCGHTYSISCVNQTHTWPACGPCGILTDAQYPIVNATRRQL